MKKKIALLTNNYVAWDGVSRLIEQRAKQFTKEGKDVTVICMWYDNSIIPEGYKILIKKHFMFNDLKEDFLIDGTLLKKGGTNNGQPKQKEVRCEKDSTRPTS